MKMKLSRTERLWVALAVIAAVFYIYWTFFLDPIIVKITRLNSDISSVKMQIAEADYQKLKSTKMAVKGKVVELPSKEVQLKNIVGFIEDKFRANSIKMVSLKQSSLDDEIGISLEFEGKYKDIRSFILDLSNIPSVLSITNVSLEQNGKKIFATMKIIAPYK